MTIGRIRKDLVARKTHRPAGLTQAQAMHYRLRQVSLCPFCGDDSTEGISSNYVAALTTMSERHCLGCGGWWTQMHGLTMGGPVCVLGGIMEIANPEDSADGEDA